MHPHRYRVRPAQLGWLLTATLTVGLALYCGAARPATSAAAPAEAQLHSQERELVALLNAARAESGAPPLEIDSVLTAAARGHCREMAAKQYFAHFSPTEELRTPLDRYRRAAGERATSVRIAENIYFCSAVSAERAHQALMASDPHRRNMLMKGWSRVGVGVHISAAGEFWVTQMFSS